MYDVRVVIIDEFCMARPALFAMIDDRLQAAKQSILPFEGVFLYLVGDIFQLPPVLAPAVYSSINSDSHFLDIRGRDLYREQFRKVFILLCNHRQTGPRQQQFRTMPHNLSRGLHSGGIRCLLNQRVRGPKDDVSNHCIISHKREKVIQTNKDKLQRTWMPVAYSKKHTSRSVCN